MADKAAVWSEHLAACRASGLSTAAFCRKRGLAYAQFMYWQRRLGVRPVGLVPVRVDAPAPVQSPVPLSVELALPIAVVRVHGASIADVLALVRGLAC